MIDERTLRRALWFSVFYNLSGTFLFAFPQSFAGRLAGLPSSVPALYAAMLGFFVLLFAGTYLWLALQREIVRPMMPGSAPNRLRQRLWLRMTMRDASGL